MRPSKNMHLLALLRNGLKLAQSDVAAKIGVHETTIQRIETGTRKLTRTLAERIGDAYDVDPDCLLANNLSRGLYTTDGQRWTAKTRREVKARLARWGNLEPYVRRTQRGRQGVLLQQYLEISHLIHQLPNPDVQLIRWSSLFMLAKGALVLTEPATENWTGKDYSCHDRLETVLDDVQAVLSEIRFIKRIEKRARRDGQNRDPKLEIKLAYIGRFGGFTECGLIVAGLIEELSESELLDMRLSDFDKLAKERCKKAGVPVPKRFDPFEAMRNYLDSVRPKRSAKK
jgi:transcriptional regulator with XRE-family HTH domain